MTNLFYETYNEGDHPVLFVHGWASSQSMWSEVHPLFTNATCYALDLPGFGKTPLFPSGTATIDDYVAALVDFCDSVVQPQMIVAHSTGGMITLKALTKRPDLAQQLLLISPVVTGRFGIQGLGSDFLRTEFGISAFRHTEPFWGIAQNILRNMTPIMHPNRQLAEQMKDNFLSTMPLAGIEVLVSMAQEDMRPHLADIKQPTLVCVGKNDTTVPPTEGATAARKIPNGTLKTFAKSAHHPMNEQPDDFAAAVRPFLQRFDLL